MVLVKQVMIRHKHVKAVVLLDKYGLIVQVNVNLSVEIKISLITPPQIPIVIIQKKELLQALDLVKLGVQIMQKKLYQKGGVVVQLPISYAENVNQICTRMMMVIV